MLATLLGRCAFSCHEQSASVRQRGNLPPPPTKLVACFVFCFCVVVKIFLIAYHYFKLNVIILPLVHQLTRTMNPTELEFLAEKEFVEIVPKFSLDSIFLMDGNLGPFKAGLPARVPLWVALDFRRRERCTIVPPYWMNVQTLELLKKEERESELFTKMPNEHYMAMTTVIFRSCSQDIPDADKVKVLIKDIWDNRISKLRTAILNFIDTGASFAKVDNLTQMEMATVRPFFPHALEHIHRLRQSARAAASNANNSRSQSFLSSSMTNSNPNNSNMI